ncbi:CinA family protein [soil metagenome]
MSAEPIVERALLDATQRCCELLRANAATIATAESCTAGLIAKQLTDIGGSSAWYDRGFVTYSNAAKVDLIGVDAALIDAQGAVSEPVALAMVSGALVRSTATIAVAVTGIAGPGGAVPGKPVGTVWIAWGARGEMANARLYHFEGDRQTVRARAATAALEGICNLVMSKVRPA